MKHQFNSTKCFVGATLLTITALLVPVPSHPAEMVVIESTAPSIRPGAVIDSDAEIELPQGTSIVVIDQSGRIRRLEGSVSKETTGGKFEAVDRKTSIALSKLIVSNERDTSSLAATRGPDDVAGKNDSPDHRFVSVSQGGTQCIVGRRSVMIWRPTPLLAEKLIIITGGGGSAVVNWPDGKSNTSWPGSLNLTAGTRYTFDRGATNPMVEVVLHILTAKLSNEEQQVAWMAAHGCTRQAKLLLESLTNSSP